MAQTDGVIFQYLGTVEVEKNITYTASQFAGMFTNANIFILKSSEAVKVSVNKTVPFEMKQNDFTYYDGSTALSYIFNRDCILAMGVLK